MVPNILISKKIDRDIGRRKQTGVHLRPNLKSIVAIEALFETEGWLEAPEIERPSFDNMDGSANLSPEMTKFWFLCGQNRDCGVNSLLRKEDVKFPDIMATDDESESETKDIKTIVKKLPGLISEVPIPTQKYLSDLYKTEILYSKNINRVTEFFELVTQIVNDSKVIIQNNCPSEDSDSSESDFEEF